MLVLWLIATSHLLRAEYQYRPVEQLNVAYKLQLSPEQLPDFHRYMLAYQRHIFSSPDSTLLAIENLRRMEGSDQYQHFLVYIETKALSAQSKYDQAYLLIEPLISYQDISKIFAGDINLSFARLNRYKGRYGEALPHFHKAQELFNQSEDYFGLALVEVNLAEFYRSLGKLKKGIAHIDTSVSYIKKHNLPKILDAYRIDRQAAIQYEMLQFGASIASTRKLISLAESLDNRFLMASGFNQLGALMELQNDMTQAGLCYGKAIALWKSAGHSRYWTNAVIHLARFYISQNQNEASIALIKENISLVKQNHWNATLSLYYGVLSRAYMAQGQYYLAFDYGDSSSTALKADLKLQISKELAVQEAAFELEQRQQMVVQLEKDKARNARQRNYAIVAAMLISALLFFMGHLAFLIRRRNKKIERINGRLTNTLQEREVLLREIHHRVKNNLQVIASLLYLQSDESSDLGVKRILKEGQGRVRSMALIYQKLSKNEDLKSIPFEEYLKELVGEIKVSFGKRAENVTLKISAKEVFFDVDTAIPLGLIVNELSTNTFKYAFEEKEGVEFVVDLKKEGTQYVLKVSDNGIGLPDHVLQAQKPGSLGLQLTVMLCDQLEGEYAFSNTGGTTFQLKFEG